LRVDLRKTTRRPKIYTMKKVIFLVFFMLTTHAFAADKLSLAELQDIAVKENPKIKSMELEAEMFLKRVPVARSLDDPKLKIGLNNVPLNNFSLREEDMTSKEIGISQMFPLGDKLKIKESIAFKDYQKSLEKLRKEKIELLNAVRMNVYELLSVREVRKIFEETREQLKLLIETQVAGNKVGKGVLSDVIKTNIEYTMIDEDLTALYQGEEELLSKLRYLTLRDVELKEEKLPDVNFKEPDYESVKEAVLKNNPELALLSLEREQSEKEVLLKQREYYPDLELGISYMQRDNSPLGMKRADMLSAMATINIPFWYKKKNIPMIEESQKKKEMVLKLIEEQNNLLMSKAKVIISQLKKWETLYKLYTEQLIPQTELAIESYVVRLSVSQTEYMPIIDTIRMLLKYKREAIMAKKEYLSNLSELNALMGVEVLK